jgi:hypothetical protein
MLRATEANWAGELNATTAKRGCSNNEPALVTVLVKSTCGPSRTTLCKTAPSTEQLREQGPAVTDFARSLPG